MATQETTKVGKRGVVVIPASLRRRYGFEDGSLVIAEGREDGILLRRAAAFPVEVYTPERKAEFLLSTALTKKDYAEAKKAVLEMGLNPDEIEHAAPDGKK